MTDELKFNDTPVQMIAILTKHGQFFATPPYLRGAKHAQEAKPAQNPYKPGPELAQYNYGYGNELAGYHDMLDLPFDIIALDDPTKFYKPGRK